MSEEISVGDQIAGLEERIRKLAGKLGLDEARGVINEIEQEVQRLPAEVERIRARGYQFRSFLENQVSVMHDQWRGIAERVQDELKTRSQELRRDLERVERDLRDLRSRYETPGSAKPAPKQTLAGSLGEAAKQKPAGALGAEKEKPRTLGDLPQTPAARGQSGREQLGGARQSREAAPEHLPESPVRKSLESADSLGSALGDSPASAPGGELPSAIAAVESAVSALEDRFDKAEWEVREHFETLSGNISKVRAHVREITWTMDQVQEATFQFSAGEAPVIIAKAEWKEDRDNPDGILYLTDRRLIFEQKEKKGGFLGIGAKKVQEIQWEVAVGDIEQAKSYNEGIFGRKDMIELTLGGSAPYSRIVVEVKGDADNDWWIRQINRARTGDILKEKLGGTGGQFDDVDLSAVPTNCPNCGGLFPDIKQGQRQLTCEFCGTVVRF
ncbi:MAG: hypothetical protein JXB47_18395 [Anaerolineae bacterium]|nr:hypothetical protein [Anaerolineae bacterium]